MKSFTLNHVASGGQRTQAALRVHGEDHVDGASETMVGQVAAPIDVAAVKVARIER
jgi:hypothetical protein